MTVCLCVLDDHHEDEKLEEETPKDLHLPSEASASSQDIAQAPHGRNMVPEN